MKFSCTTGDLVTGDFSGFDAISRSTHLRVRRCLTSPFFAILKSTVELREWAEAHFFIAIDFA